MSQIHIYKHVELLNRALADFFIETANNAIAEHDSFTVALSGGNSPKKLYELLASEDYKPKVNWQKVYFFLSDERYVPADDRNSNALMIRETLLAPLEIADDSIFMMDTTLQSDAAASEYWERISAHFKTGPIRFDLILLGLGDNAHTASLFPHTAVLQEKTATVKAVYVPELGAYRITFTAPLINQAHHIAFLVYGAAKADAIKYVFGKNNPGLYPAQLIYPDTNDGTLDWFLDKDAAVYFKG